MEARLGAGEIAVVVRHQNFGLPAIRDEIDLMSAHLDLAEADREAARKNAAARPHATYFVKIVSEPGDLVE